MDESPLSWPVSGFPQCADDQHTGEPPGSDRNCGTRICRIRVLFTPNSACVSAVQPGLVAGVRREVIMNNMFHGRDQTNHVWKITLPSGEVLVRTGEGFQGPSTLIKVDPFTVPPIEGVSFPNPDGRGRLTITQKDIDRGYLIVREYEGVRAGTLVVPVFLVPRVQRIKGSPEAPSYSEW